MLEQVALKGAPTFYGALLSVGLLYHLYNQVSGLIDCWVVARG